MNQKTNFLQDRIQHISLDCFDPVPLIEAMETMAFQARNTARAARIYETMLRDTECSVILCLAGSLISAGLKKVLVQMVEQNMVDAIVSTGANIVDQDFFEGLGFHHYIGRSDIDDEELRRLGIDRHSHDHAMCFACDFAHRAIRGDGSSCKRVFYCFTYNFTHSLRVPQ